LPKKKKKNYFLQVDIHDHHCQGGQKINPAEPLHLCLYRCYYTLPNLELRCSKSSSIQSSPVVPPLSFFVMRELTKRTLDALRPRLLSMGRPEADGGIYYDNYAGGNRYLCLFGVLDFVYKRAEKGDCGRVVSPQSSVVWLMGRRWSAVATEKSQDMSHFSMGRN